MRFKSVKELTIKELKTFFDNISGYLFLGIFLGLTYYFFLQGFFIAGVASVREMFQLMPWYLTILVPAVTMGAFAYEKDKQTLENIITKPLRASEIVAGKVLGPAKFITIGLLLTIPLPIFISRIGNIDIGETFAAYLGTILLIFALVSIGVTVSSFFRNQISAFITTTVIIILLNILGTSFASINLSTQTANFLASLSITEHYYSITRGILDLNDIFYFAMIILFTNAITYVVIRNIRFNAIKEAFSTTLITILGITFFALAIYYTTGYVYGRLDLTSSKKYTLSEVTKGILNRENLVIIDVYASEDMPFEYEFRLNELKNILDDYDRSGRDLLVVNYKDASENEAQLAALGIAPVEFRTFGEDQLQVNQGYLAVVIQDEDGEKQEIMPFINNVDNLEYELSTRIYRVKTDDKTKVAFASGNGERSITNEYQLLGQVIGNDIEIESVSFTVSDTETTEDIEGEGAMEPILENEEGTENSTLPDLTNYDLLVIPNPTTLYDQESVNLINQFIDNGGNVLYLVDTMDVDLSSPSTEAMKPEDGSRGNLLSKYDIKVNSDMVYDLRSHLNISVPSGNPVIPMVPYPYPLFLVGQVNENPKVVNVPDTVAMAWPSSYDASDEWHATYITTPYAGISTGTNIDPKQIYNEENLGEHPLIMTRKLDSGSTLMVISTARVFDNDFLQNYPDNAMFATATFDYLADGVGFSTIQAKSINVSRFSFVEEVDKQLIKFGAPLLSFLMLIGIGIFRIIRRKLIINKYSTL